MKKTLATALMMLAATVAAFGQAGVGSISGTVTDAMGLVVPGASVTVANESKGIRRAQDTTGAGIFAADALVPADGYTVTINKPGFSQYQIKDLQLQVGQTLNLAVQLSVAGAATQVQVQATAPVVDSTKTDVSMVVDASKIEDLPINGRRVDSFALLSPAVVPDGNFGLISFRGVAGGNSFLTDGNDTTEQYYNENAGRTRIQSQIGQDAVQEFQVVSNNYSAEFGRAMGGVVNTITRSGSNDFHGTGYWFFRNQDFNARDLFATFVPQEKRNQFGASAGGKVIQDKLFYFFNYEGLRRNFPLISSLTAAGNGIFDSTGKFIATCGAPATPAQCATASSFFGRLNQTLERTVTQDLGFGKIDYHINDRNTISASMNVLRWVSPNGLQTQAALTNGIGVGGNANSSVRSKYGRLAWTSVPTNTIVNEFRFGWFKDKQFDYPNDALAIPGIGFLGITITPQANLGTATDYPRTNPSENRFQYADTLSWVKGAHSLKFGLDISRTEEYTNLLFNRTGTFTFPNFTAFAQDLSGNTTGGKNWASFTQAVGNPVLDFFMTDYGMFAQDQYKPTTHLTINAGVRYDYSQLPTPTITNPDYPATGRIPTKGNQFAPRIGFAYAFGSDGKTVVRAGGGLFYGRYPGGLINTLMLGNGLYQKSLSLTASNAADRAAGPVFPNVFPTNANLNPPAGAVSLNIASKDFRSPYSMQADVAIERKIGNDVSLSVSYITSRGLHLTSVNDINIGAPGPAVTYRINDAAGAQVGTYTTPVYVRQNRVDPRYSRVNIVDAGLNSWYNGMAVQLNKRVSHGMSGSASYTWSHAIDQGQGGAGTPNIFASGGPQSYVPGDYRLERASSLLDIRHRLVLTGIFTPTLTKSDNAAARFLLNGWELATLATLSSSPNATPTVSVGTTPAAAGFTAANNGTLNGYTSGGLGGRVPFQPINSMNLDRIYRLDTRLSKSFRFKERYKAMFSFDAFNVFNHRYATSISTREYNYALVSGVPTLSLAAGFGAGTATGGFPDGTNARRLQIGARFVW